MRHILLVEPDRVLAETINKYLTSHSMEVETATDAQSAISSADKTKPDIIVIELAMPKNNGVALLQELRSYTDWLNVPVIIYSKIPLEDTGLSTVQWRKYGVTAYLYKPTKSLANLLMAIEDI